MSRKPSYPGGKHGDRTSTWDDVHHVKIDWIWQEYVGEDLVDLVLDGKVIAISITRESAAIAAGELLKSKSNEEVRVCGSKVKGDWFLI